MQQIKQADSRVLSALAAGASHRKGSGHGEEDAAFSEEVAAWGDEEPLANEVYYATKLVTHQAPKHE